MESYYASEAKIRLRDILNAADHGEPTEIKRYTTPTAIVVPVPWYQDAAELIAMARQAVTRGGFTHADMLTLQNRYGVGAAGSDAKPSLRTGTTTEEK